MGLQQSNRATNTAANNNVPNGTWIKRNNHFYMESLDYTLQIVRELIIDKGKACYIVQQSHPVNGEKRFALIDVENF